jgi:hypothetical protein
MSAEHEKIIAEQLENQGLIRITTRKRTSGIWLSGQLVVEVEQLP